MREFKFRAFNKNDNKMWKPFLLREVNEGFIERSLPHATFPERVLLSECIVMQFTGLFDRIGNEIYEGDLFENVFAPIGQQIEIVRFGEYELDLDDYVAYAYGFFVEAVLNPCYGQRLTRYSESNGSVIIGNIYENSNLVKIA